jgi:FkbM family methyltransferase
MHRGHDSAFYLAKGYRVVAFEADPDHVAHAHERFAPEIAAGQMTIVAGAVTADGHGTVRFFRHSLDDAWGTVDETWVARNSTRGESEAIEVPATDFAETLREHGIPWYMKIDIEGTDRVCLESLRQFDERPRYLSIESEKARWATLLEEFDLLESLGYGRFAVVQQQGMDQREIVTTRLDGSPLTYRFEEISSGPFGDDLGDAWGDRATAEAAYCRIFRDYRRFGDDSLMNRTRPTRVLRRALSTVLGRPLPGWYDTHVCLADSGPTAD